MISIQSFPMLIKVFVQFFLNQNRTMANLVLHMYAAANTVMTVNRILIFPIPLL